MGALKSNHGGRPVLTGATTHSTTPVVTGVSARARRVRFGSLPKPPERIEVPYGLEREEFAGMSCGQLTEIILSSQAFIDVLGPICDKLDANRARLNSNIPRVPPPT